MHDDYGPIYLTGENVKFHGGFGKKCRISRNFLLLFFEPPTPLTWNKAYLRYPMSLTVILLLIVMLTAGPDRLYRVARSHVQLGLYIARTDCILMDNGTAPAPWIRACSACKRYHDPTCLGDWVVTLRICYVQSVKLSISWAVSLPSS